MKKGQWSDDTSMAWCLADTIANRGYKGSDVRKRYWNWQAEGLNNCFRKDPEREKRNSFGLGYNIAKFLMSLDPGEEPTDCFQSPSEDAGNGSLMRLAPISIFYGKKQDDLLKFAGLSSMATHPGALASETCQFLSVLTSRAIHRQGDENIQQFMNDGISEYMELRRGCDIFGKPYDATVLNQLVELLSSSPSRRTEACWDWKSSSLKISESLKARGTTYNGHPVSGGYFGSFCMDGLAMALHSVYHTNSFEEAITKAVNLLGDADSVGAIAGQLAGAFYGHSAMLPNAEPIKKWDDNDIALRAALLYLFSKQDDCQN
eukprot:TRINITY_DN1665_c0_g1_i1.p1 TRINITY_DN1665_c0_g1~~TRINITY_DN1665_c0_g1_i1.p1  ORF type:complete len:318 (+),score=57.15 TRINITY_DN1665_c0_g1_i1:2686-3639(+)